MESREGRRALLALNRKCRSGGVGLDEVAGRLRAMGLTAVTMETERPAEISRAIRAHAADTDLVVLAGGDGTLNSAAEALVETGLPLAVLPLGTANDLARTLGIPSLDAACETIASGRLHHIDLGVVNGKLFFNVASIGLSVRVTKALRPDVKRRWGALGYAVAALRTLRQARPFAAHIVCGAEHLDVRSVQLAIGNGRFYGGGFPIAADATIDDGLLHLYSLDPGGMLHYVSIIPALHRGPNHSRSGLTTVNGSEIAITTERPLPVNTDGELTTRTPARFGVVRKALQVMVPADYGGGAAGGGECCETTSRSPSTT